MSVSEPDLREQYRRASDEELAFLARQGSSEFTPTAWALLQEEMTRRRLAPPQAAPRPPRAQEEPVQMEPGMLPLLRWGEVPDRGIPERSAELSEQEMLALDAEEDAPEPEATAPPSHVVTAEFTGRGGEYFRIWVVNLLLTALTLGLYSGWSKVRRVKYFRQNTWLDGHVFDYHGNPVAILRGRLLALVLLAAYSWAFQFSNVAGLVTVATLCAAGPWLFMRAQQFSLANTSFLGLRFGFRAGPHEAYATVLPALALWLLPGVAAALATDVHWWFGLPALAFPWMHHRLKAFQRRHATYGDREFTFAPARLQFYWVYVKGLGLVMVGGLIAGLVFAVLLVLQLVRGRAVEVATGAIGETMAFVAVFFTYLLTWPYCGTRLQQVVWSHTRLASIAFRTDIRAVPLFRLVLKNVALIILTCGIYWPWAAVALARYRVGCMRVESDVALSTLAAGVQAPSVSPTGDAAADFFGLDIGF
jgi:uncharacterized membrane protein YjgN (DUF898 family)